MNVTAYSKYYKVQLEEALLYQDFVVDAALSLLSYPIMQYSSRAYQQAVGESKSGVEIKHDKLFKKTGNLWIEISEKSRPREGDYFPSGIERDDNTWLYFIGDYDTIFVFPKSLLRGLANSGRYEMRENNTRTSTGFLLPGEDARRYAAAILEPNAETKVKKLVTDLNELGRELHQLVKGNPGQATLFGDPIGNG